VTDYTSCDDGQNYAAGTVIKIQLLKRFNDHIKTAQQRTIIDQYCDCTLMGGLLHLVQRGKGRGVPSSLYQM